MQTITVTSDDSFIATLTDAHRTRIARMVKRYITGWRYHELVDESTNTFRAGVWQGMQSYRPSAISREDWCARRGYGAVADYLRTQLGRRQRITHMTAENTMLSEYDASKEFVPFTLDRLMRDTRSVPTDVAAIAEIEFQTFLAGLKPIDRDLAVLITTGEFRGTLLACGCLEGHSFQADVTRATGKPRWTVEQALARLRKLMRGKP